MADHRAGGDLYRTARTVRDLLPRSATVIEAFRGSVERDHPARKVLAVAAELVVQHRRQWRAEDTSRADGASAEEIVAAKRLIDELNARRVAFIEEIDLWVAREIRGREEASLHTETFGSVVDRMAIAWVRMNSLRTTPAADARDRARLALRQLAELADAYDDLVRDLDAGQRRLPMWRSLKTYRSHS